MVLYMAAYLFMNLGAFACVILFRCAPAATASLTTPASAKDPLITWASASACSPGRHPTDAEFFGKIYLFFAGWADGQYLLVVVGLVTSVVSIYYYISVIKMMVVKEPQEASDVIRTSSSHLESARSTAAGCLVFCVAIPRLAVCSPTPCSPGRMQLLKERPCCNR